MDYTGAGSGGERGSETADLLAADRGQDSDIAPIKEDREPSLRLEVLAQVAEVLEAKHLRNSLSASARAELLQIGDFQASLARTRVVAVVGAGASSMRYPRGSQLLEQVRNEFGDRYTARDIDLISDMSARRPGLETAFSAMSSPPSRGHAVRTAIAEAFSTDRPTTLTYELIAHLLKHRYLDAVINFNFDELLDHSIRSESGEGEYRFVVSDRNTDGVVADPDSAGYIPLYIKPHGTASAPDSMRFTLEDYFSPSKSARELIARVLGSGPLLILNFGYGLADPDFCALLRGPARATIVDCSYVPVRHEALDEIRRSSDDNLDDVRAEDGSPAGSDLVDEVEISRHCGLDRYNGGARQSPLSGGTKAHDVPDLGEYGQSLRRTGRRLTYYWLDHAWIRSSVERGDEDLFDEDEWSPLDGGSLNELPLSFVGNDLPGPAQGLRRQYVRAIISNATPRPTFDPGALQLLDLVSYLDDRARPTRRVELGQSANRRRVVEGPTHYYRSEARHLAVGLFCEFTTLSRDGVDDPKSYWRDRALLELAMFMVESGGETTSEDLALSRARRYFDHYRSFGGDEQFRDIYALLEIQEGPRGIRYLGAARRKRLERTYAWEDNDVNHPADQPTARNAQLSGLEQELRDLGYLHLKMPNAPAATRTLARNLARHCGTVQASLQADFLSYLGKVLLVLAHARVSAEIASRDDRVCTGIFRSPVKLGSHTSLNAHSKLALTRLRSEERSGAARGRSELWISTTTGGFLSHNEYLLSGLREYRRRQFPGSATDPDDPILHHRAVDVRLVCSAAHMAFPAGVDELRRSIASSVQEYVHGAAGAGEADSVDVALGFLPWWQITRHIMLSLVDRTPVAGVYFVRQRLSRVISPVYVTDPDDLSVLHAMHRRMWHESIDLESRAEGGHEGIDLRDFRVLSDYDHTDGAGERRSDRRSGVDRRVLANTNAQRPGFDRREVDRRRESTERNA